MKTLIAAAMLSLAAATTLMPPAVAAYIREHGLYRSGA